MLALVLYILNEAPMLNILSLLQAFSVTKISSMFDKSKKRGHDVDAIKVASVDEKVEEDNAPEAFNPASNKTESKCKGTLKHRLRKFLKHFN